MTQATLELYHALIDAGIPQDKAEAAAKAVISRQEAKDFLVSKEDLLSLKSEIYKAMMVQAGAIVSMIGVIIALFSLLA